MSAPSAIEKCKAQPLAPGHLHLPELDRRYRHALRAFFLSRGCAPAMADDLTQEVFVRILSYRRPDTITNTRAFVFRTAGNLLRDVFRSARRWNLASLDDPEETPAEPRDLIENLTPERLLEGHQDVRVVAEAFEELDPRMQRIFLLSRAGLLRHRDIANRLGVSLSLVEKTLRSAQDHLKARFQRQRIRKDASLAWTLASPFIGLEDSPSAASAYPSRPQIAGGTV